MPKIMHKGVSYGGGGGTGGGGNHVELTQAEYDALTSIDPNTVYFITDGDEDDEIDGFNTKALVDAVYPVGSIYMSVNNVSPATFFGGTWEQIKDRFLLSAGDTYDAGSVGGDATHQHKYGIQYGAYYGAVAMESSVNSGALVYDKNGNITVATSQTDSVNLSGLLNGSVTQTSTSKDFYHYKSIGSTSYDSSMPPYLAVYMWKRTA